MVCPSGSGAKAGAAAQYYLNETDLRTWFGTAYDAMPPGFWGSMFVVEYQPASFCLTEPTNPGALTTAEVAAAPLFPLSYFALRQKCIDLATLFTWQKLCQCNGASAVLVNSLSSSVIESTPPNYSEYTGPFDYGAQLDHVVLTGSVSAQVAGHWRLSVQWYNAQGVFISEGLGTTYLFSDHGPHTNTLAAPTGATQARGRIFSSDATAIPSWNLQTDTYAIPTPAGVPWSDISPVAALPGPTFTTGNTTDSLSKQIAQLAGEVAFLQLLVKGGNSNVLDITTALTDTQTKAGQAKVGVDAANTKLDTLSSDLATVSDKVAALARVGAVSGTSLSVGASGSNDVALPAGTVAVSVVVTAFPTWKGSNWAAPIFRQDLGVVSLVGLDGVIETRNLDTEQTFWVDIPPSATNAAVQLAPGVVASIATYEKA